MRNAGNKAGTEIVQFYVHDVAASMVRPVKELVGFAKVNLQPGEEKTVCLSLPMSQLAFLDADMRWKVEHGKVELMAGVYMVPAGRLARQRLYLYKESAHHVGTYK